MKDCPFLAADPTQTSTCMTSECALWDDKEHRCDVTTMTERLREMCESMTADKQPGEPVEGVLLETEPLIPEFPADVSSDHCIEHGWWNLMENCVFEVGRAENLREYYIREGFDVRLEHVFGDGRTDDQFFRLWFRHKKGD